MKIQIVHINTDQNGIILSGTRWVLPNNFTTPLSEEGESLSRIEVLLLPDEVFFDYEVLISGHQVELYCQSPREPWSTCPDGMFPLSQLQSKLVKWVRPLQPDEKFDELTIVVRAANTLFHVEAV